MVRGTVGHGQTLSSKDQKRRLGNRDAGKIGSDQERTKEGLGEVR